MTLAVRPARSLALVSALLIVASPSPIGRHGIVTADGGTPTEDEVAEATVVHSAVDTNRPEPGDDVDITLPAETFTSGETVDIHLFTTPVVLGQETAGADGEEFEGIYEARIPVAYAECLWGIDPTSLVTDLEVAVIDEDGTERAEGEFVASITIVDDMLHIDADGFHLSEPDVVVRSTGGFVSLDEPVRILNTRTGAPVGADDLGGNGTPHTLQVPGDLIPTTATAVALNVTVVNGRANDFGGYVTVYPCGTKPDASNLNFTSGQTIPNSVIAPLSPTGQVCLYVYGQAHLLVDVSGHLAG